MVRAWLWRATGIWMVGTAAFAGFWAASAVRADVGSLNGSWMSACLNEAGQHLKRDMYFSGGMLYSTTSIYTDQGCFNLMMRLETHYSYVISGDSRVLAGASEIDLSYERSFVTTFSAALSDRWAVGRFCGIIDWDVGIPHQVTGRKCGDHQVPKPGAKEFDLYLRDSSGVLWIGLRTRELDASLPEKRPREANRSFSLRRVGG